MYNAGKFPRGYPPTPVSRFFQVWATIYCILCMYCDSYARVFMVQFNFNVVLSSPTYLSTTVMSQCNLPPSGYHLALLWVSSFFLRIPYIPLPYIPIYVESYVSVIQSLFLPVIFCLTSFAGTPWYLQHTNWWLISVVNDLAISSLEGQKPTVTTTMLAGIVRRLR